MANSKMSDLIHTKEVLAIAERKLARVEALLTELRAKAYDRLGSCATGYTDYQHSHSYASDCAACGERAAAGKALAMLEDALGLKPKDKPCFLTAGGAWCEPHRRAAAKCKRRK